MCGQRREWLVVDEIKNDVVSRGSFRSAAGWKGKMEEVLVVILILIWSTVDDEPSIPSWASRHQVQL